MSPLRLSPLQHVLSFAGAVAVAATLFIGAAATAQGPANGPAYRAELAQPVTATRLAAAGVTWNCNGTTCTAPRSNSRPAIVCARFAREAGQLVSFSHGGSALPSDQLARCNASAG